MIIPKLVKYRPMLAKKIKNPMNSMYNPWESYISHICIYQVVVNGVHGNGKNKTHPT